MLVMRLSYCVLRHLSSFVCVILKSAIRESASPTMSFALLQSCSRVGAKKKARTRWKKGSLHKPEIVDPELSKLKANCKHCEMDYPPMLAPPLDETKYCGFCEEIMISLKDKKVTKWMTYHLLAAYIQNSCGGEVPKINCEEAADKLWKEHVASGLVAFDERIGETRILVCVDKQVIQRPTAR